MNTQGDTGPLQTGPLWIGLGGADTAAGPEPGGAMS
jgi:hypothetical protein